MSGIQISYPSVRRIFAAPKMFRERFNEVIIYSEAMALADVAVLHMLA